MGDHGGVARGTTPRDHPLGPGSRGGEVDRRRPRQPHLPSRVRPHTDAGRDRRHRGSGLRCRPADRRCAFLRVPAGAGRRGRLHPAVDPGGHSRQGSRARVASADDPGDQRGRTGSPGRRPHRSEPGARDHVRQGRRLGRRDRGPRGGPCHPEGVHPRRVPRLPQRRRDRVRDGRGAEERDRDRGRHRRRARRRATTPGRP